MPNKSRIGKAWNYLGAKSESAANGLEPNLDVKHQDKASSFILVHLIFRTADRAACFFDPGFEY
jgi:hypothetical protein